MKKWALVLICGILLSAGSSHGQEIPMTAQEDSTSHCAKNVQINIGGKDLLVDKSFHFVPKSGGSFVLDIKRNALDCAVTKLDNIKMIKRDSFTVGEEKGKINDINRAKIYNDLLAEKNAGNFKQLPNGVIKVTKGSDFYIFPKEKIKTKNLIPVIFICSLVKDGEVLLPISAASCWTDYDHPSGLYISYSFYRKKFKEEDFLNADLEKRKQLEAMIIKGTK